MKVLENWMVKLDVLPGSSQAELSKQASAQIGEAGDQASSAIKSQASSIYQKLPEDQRQLLQQGLDTLSPEQKTKLQDSIMQQLPAEQQAQAKSYLKSAGDVGMGMAGMVGGGVKGTVDTLGNTVGALAGGLAQTGNGMVSGAKDTAGMGEKKSGGGAVNVKDLEGAAKKKD